MAAIGNDARESENGPEVEGRSVGSTNAVRNEHGEVQESREPQGGVATGATAGTDGTAETIAPGADSVSSASASGLKRTRAQSGPHSGQRRSSRFRALSALSKGVAQVVRGLQGIRSVPMHDRLVWASKVGAATLVLVLLGSVFLSRFQIGVDTQSDKCIHGTVFLIDKADKELERGALFAYRSRGTKWIYPDGTLMVKAMQGLPGDRVEVTPDFEVRVNGIHKAQGLPLAGTLTASEARRRFCGSATLQSDEAWMLGTLPHSFDSRYWGPIKTEQIVGRAYVVF